MNHFIERSIANEFIFLSRTKGISTDKALSKIWGNQLFWIKGCSVFARSMGSYSCLRRRSRIKVCVLGADSAAGAPLCTLLQRLRLVDDLTLYGRKRPERLAAELSCMPERPVIEAYGPDCSGLQCALRDAQLVLLAEGAFRSAAITRDQHFDLVAKSACEYGRAIGAHAPSALVGVMTVPVSAVMPVVWECVRRSGGRQPERRVIGITQLQTARAATHAARVLRTDPTLLKIVVAGGTCGAAVVPILSTLEGTEYSLTQLEASAVTASITTSGSRLRRLFATGHGTSVPCRGDPADIEDCGTCTFGGATSNGMNVPAFSAAYAATKFADIAIRAIGGYRCLHANVFSLTKVTEKGMEFSTSTVMLGNNGIMGLAPLPGPNEMESRLLKTAEGTLLADLNMAKSFLTSVFGPSELPHVGSDVCYDFTQTITNPATRCKGYWDLIDTGTDCYPREQAPPSKNTKCT